MTVDEMLARMSSAELSAWHALYRVRAEEAEYQRHLHDSGDGQVFISGRDDDEDEDDD